MPYASMPVNDKVAFSAIFERQRRAFGVVPSLQRCYEEDMTMTPEEFRKWRKSLGFTQAEAAKALGVGKRTVTAYESDGPVPTQITLACERLTLHEYAHARVASWVDTALLPQERHPKVATGTEMTPEEFRKWRKSLGFTQAEAAKALGVGKRTVTAYESDGPVPTQITLACKALALQDAFQKLSHARRAAEILAAGEKSFELEMLVKEQHPELKIGDTALMLPFEIKRGKTYTSLFEPSPDLLEQCLSNEARDWLSEQANPVIFSLKRIETPSGDREIGVAIFASLVDAVHFKFRWS
jgi:transcriptional regulator with XRE-family HTH domain